LQTTDDKTLGKFKNLSQVTLTTLLESSRKEQFCQTLVTASAKTLMGFNHSVVYRVGRCP